MKKLVGIISIVGFLLSNSVFAADAQNCVSLDPKWGSRCGSPDSLHIKVKNRCSQRVYVKICLEKKDRKWNCGSDGTLDPGETNTGFYTCHATGDYRWSACTKGSSECGFRNPK
ncbi:hypothetical protein Q4508_03225 [Amphritea sp. 2_MG-2023]|uniref:hypothetical protein n=1 Tax=Amphritea TaxID=515417 RepID=UPI001C077E87|nr:MULTISPECIES: hypothetical protein [Amphritea]MBU2966579.1 hypothetical protein [Amphritea atlantica]MDO6417562.1 hypothetical protein [Amphritea sp. 2_MG-2023]